MKEKVNYLNFFFGSESYPQGPQVNNKIADLFPALIFVYHVPDGRLTYANEKFKNCFSFSEHNDPVLNSIPASEIFGDGLKVLHNDICQLGANEQKKLKWKLKGFDLDVNIAALDSDEDGTP